MPGPLDGSRDVAAQAAALAERLPGGLAPLAGLAYNYRWSWALSAGEPFEAVDPERWDICGNNPVRLLGEARLDVLSRAASRQELVTAIDAEGLSLRQEIAAPAVGPSSNERPIAFLCAEFGIHGSLPIYSGGLGVLAGDILKEASDRHLPMVGVGILYRQGFFHQRLDITGWQHEYFIATEPDRLPAALVTGADGLPLTVSVPVADRQVVAQIWRVDVGRTPLFLLDTFRPENERVDRFIGSRLYTGDRTVRLWQYLLLGIGGVRALRAMGYDPVAFHLNEGHAAFAPLELAREAVEAGMPLDQALASARSRTLFTTHTPVAAGNDVYDPALIRSAAPALLEKLGGAEAVLALARTRPGDQAEGFGVTQLALRMSRSANAVSSRHGHVARAMWQPMWPDRPVDSVPIRHVTNGVHLPTWMAPEMRELLTRYLGKDWEKRAADPTTWVGVDEIPDVELWAVRMRLRQQLVEFVRDRSAQDRLSRGESLDYVEAAANSFDPEVLTLGFARRLASYKRVHLLTYDPGRSVALLDGERPLQLVVAGKAHPQDDDAKRIVQQQLFPLRSHPQVGRRVAYIEDYALPVALTLVRGCDIWINVPRPPLEASGTSGMKAAMNGSLNVSILDGWWEEAFDGQNGWGFGGDTTGDDATMDARDAKALYDILEREVVPLFHDRDELGVPRGWVRKMKQSLRTIGPRFSAGRMLAEYAGLYAGG